MPFNPFTLAFTGQWRHLEPGFLIFSVEESIARMRIAILSGIFFYAIFGILDHVLVPDKEKILWGIRYLVVIPCSSWVFFMSFRPGFKTKSQPLLFLMCLVGGLGIVCMIILAGPPAAYSYYAGIILVFITAHTFVGLRFLWASACSWTIVACYEIAAVWFAQTPVIILINNNFFFISSAIICMMAGYTNETNARYRYFSAHLLTREKEKVARINRGLDQAVKEKTRDLSLANDQLKKEIKERAATQARQLKLEKELNRKQKLEAIGTLAGGIAHDFNNILSAVMGYTELSMEEPDTQVRRNHQGQVLKATLRARDLIAQILAFSRQTEQEMLPLNPSQITQEALKLLRASMPAGIEMRTRFSARGMVMADPSQIHRIIVNLCTNAFHAMPDHMGTIEVTVEDIAVDALLDTNQDGLVPGPYVRLTISDTGTGMTPEVMEKIFDPFFTTKPVDQGTGMGLSVVHGVIKQYRGSIRVYSEPGQGTTFTILLPCTVQTQAKDQISEDAPVPGGTESIFVIDDEILLARALEQTLRGLGYEVTSFSSPTQALAHLKENVRRPDLIITDFTMPKMNGIQLAQQVNAGARIPVILCTGYSEKLIKERMFSANIQGFMLKPLIRRTTAETVRKVLDARSPDLHSR